MALPTSRRHPRLSDAFPLVLLAVLVFGFFSPVLFGDHSLVGVHTASLSPWTLAPDAGPEPDVTPLAADKTLVFDPQLRASLARLAAGEVPHWSDREMFGMPLLAQAVHGVFHWPTWLALLIPAHRAYGWIAALQTLVAAVGMYLLARSLHLARWPAFLGALCFAFSGYFAMRWHFFQIQGATIYLPWMIWGIERLFRGAGWGTVAMTAVVVACSLLAGFPQGSVHALYAAAVWAAARWALGLRFRQPSRPGRAVARCSIAFALGLALGLPQLLPSLAFARDDVSARTPPSPEVLRSFGMRPTSLVTLVAPHVLGHPDDLAEHDLPQLRSAGSLRPILVKPHLADNHHVETACTISIAGLIMLALGLRWRHPGRALAAGLFTAGLVLSLDTPLLLVVAHLPGLDQGDPRRFLSWVCFGGSLVAACGLARLLREGPSVRYGTLTAGWAAVTVVLAVAAHQISPTVWVGFVAPLLADAYGISTQEVFRNAGDLPLGLALLRRSLDVLAALSVGSAAAVWWARRRSGREPAAALLIGLAAFELVYLVAARELSTTPAAGFEDEPPGLEAWTTEPVGGGRVHRFLPADDGSVRRDVLNYPLPPTTGAPFGVRDASAYLALSNRRVEALHELLEPGSAFGVGVSALARRDALTDPLLDVMAVEKVVVTERDLPDLADLDVAPIDGSPGLFVWANDDAVPRASLAPAALLVESSDDAQAALAERTFDPRQVVVVEHPLDLGVAADAVPHDRAAPPAADGTPPGSVTWRTDEPERLVLDVDAARATWLVVADAWAPGWTAEVTTPDGATAVTPVLPAQLAFRAVPVPAGASTVTLRYESPGWPLARTAALVALAAILVCAALGFARR